MKRQRADGSAGMISWCARFGGVRHASAVVAAMAGVAIASVGCMTYDDLAIGVRTEAGSGDARTDASVGACNVGGSDACGDALPRDASTSDTTPRTDASSLPDGARWDRDDEPGSLDARSESADDGASDTSSTGDVGDADAGPADVDDAELDGGTGTDAPAADARDEETGAIDVRDEEAAAIDVRDSPPVDATDVSNPPTFYRAINVGGSDATALIIDGHSWEAGLTAPNVTYSTGTDAAGSGGLAHVVLPLIPPTDANRTSMIQAFAWGRPVSLTMSSVPAGRYLVYMYTWEDNGAQTFNVLVQGQVVLANYNSGADGHWERLGPWPVDVSNGTIVLSTTPSTGAAFANLCGIEVWRE